MAETRPARKVTKRSAATGRGATSGDPRPRNEWRRRSVAHELKAEKTRAEGEKDVLAKIAQMPEPDRTTATRLHAIITATAPALAPKIWLTKAVS